MINYQLVSYEVYWELIRVLEKEQGQGTENAQGPADQSITWNSRGWVVARGEFKNSVKHEVFLKGHFVLSSS